MLVAAQSCWKLAVNAEHSPFQNQLNASSIIKFALSPLVIAGLVIYAAATLLYMYLLSRYKFSLIQSLAIPLSLLFSIGVAVIFFGDHLTIINYIGLVFIVAGIVFMTL